MRKYLYIFFSALCLFSFFTYLGISFASDVVINSSPVFFVTAGAGYSYHVTATSAKGLPIQFSFPSLPSWLSFNTSNDNLQGKTTAVGTYTITVVANNSKGASDTQRYFLYVTAPTQTPAPTQTSAPTTTPPSPSTTTPTSIPTPTPTSSISPSEQPISISNLTPKDGSTINSFSPQISGKIVAGFPLDKKSFNLFFDNADVTNQVSLQTVQTDPTHFSNSFSYQTKNISEGKHNVNFTVTNSQGISIPQQWSFSAEKPTTPMTVLANIGNFLLHNKVGNILIAIILLLFILIIARLFSKSRQKPV